VSEDALPPLGAGFRLRAEVDVGTAGTGILCALGDWSNGWAWYLLAGKPVLVFNVLGELFRYGATEPIAAGARVLTADYRHRRGQSATVTLAVDGTPVAEGPLAHWLPLRWQIGGAGLLVGRDRGFPVCDDYQPPFPFSGTIHRVVIEVQGFTPPDVTQQVAAILRHE
jgi:arylsulfatase